MLILDNTICGRKITRFLLPLTCLCNMELDGIPLEKYLIHQLISKSQTFVYRLHVFIVEYLIYTYILVYFFQFTYRVFSHLDISKFNGQQKKKKLIESKNRLSNTIMSCFLIHNKNLTCAEKRRDEFMTTSSCALTDSCVDPFCRKSLKNVTFFPVICPYSLIE